jgi:hypothetical protein
MADRLKSSEKHLRAQQAKEFLISQILEQAQMDNVPLSEVERKMLFFTETEETLPDMLAVNDQFDRECDRSAYESKIAGLAEDTFERLRQESPDGERRWKQAISDLRKEDHYLLVMVDQASRSVRPAYDRLKLWGTGLAIAGAAVGAAILAAKYNVDLDKYMPSKDAAFLVFWGIPAILVIVLAVLRLLLGKQRIDRMFARLTESVFGRTSPEK